MKLKSKKQVTSNPVINRKPIIERANGHVTDIGYVPETDQWHEQDSINARVISEDHDCPCNLPLKSFQAEFAQNKTIDRLRYHKDY